MATVIGRNRKSKVNIQNKKNTNDITITEIKKQLDTLGIEYKVNATKADLLTLLPQKG